MPAPRSASMVPSLRRSRSASMSSLAQVDLGSLDQGIVLDYARKVMQLQPQPATSAEKLQMLFALSQKLLRWFLEDRDQAQKYCNPLQPNTASQTEEVISPLHVEKIVPQSGDTQQSKESDKPSVASRILASAVVPVSLSDINPAINLDLATPSKSIADPIQVSPVRPAEPAIVLMRSSSKSVLSSLQSVTENEPLVEESSLNAMVPAAQHVSVPQEANLLPPPTQDALQVYLQVQRSVICMQKYVRGFMARRRFFRALEELLQGHA